MHKLGHIILLNYIHTCTNIKIAIAHAPTRTLCLTRTHVCARAHTHTRTHTHTHICSQTQMHTYAHSQTHIHPRTRAPARARPFSDPLKHTHTHTHTHTRTHAHMLTCTRTLSPPNKNIYTRARSLILTYASTHILPDSHHAHRLTQTLSLTFIRRTQAYTLKHAHTRDRQIEAQSQFPSLHKHAAMCIGYGNEQRP
jgi:hypothetical protein